MAAKVNLSPLLLHRQYAVFHFVYNAGFVRDVYIMSYYDHAVCVSLCLGTVKNKKYASKPDALAVAKQRINKATDRKRV